MNLRIVPGLFAWIACFNSSPACGPFFPDTVLDLPQASLGVPPFSYLEGLNKLTGRGPLKVQREVERTFVDQIPLEVAELKGVWQTAGLSEQAIADRVKHYEAVRTEMLGRVTDVGLMEFKTKADVPLALAENPLGADFPADVADYIEGARLHGIGKTEEARTLWKSLLKRPAEERRLRGVWAAWMLAKTSKELDECLTWYQRVEAEAASGGSDILDLANAAKSWRAARLENPIEGIRLFFEAYQHGRNSAAIDLRMLVSRLLQEKEPDILAIAAADPIVRPLVNLELQSSISRSLSAPVDLEEEDSPSNPPDEWLAALEAHAHLPMEDGSRIAWALYSDGRFSEAKHWLDLSVKDDPMSLWLQAKFDLRSGQLDEANKHLSLAIKALSGAKDWHPLSPTEGMRWEFEATVIQGATQGRLLADAGVVSLAREDYSQALECLRQGGYEADAAYVAECVLSTEELTRFVRLHAPVWNQTELSDQEDQEEEPLVGSQVQEAVDPATALTNGQGSWSPVLGPDNRLRWQLARRLAREGKLKEASEFMPPSLAPLWDHYLKLDDARRSAGSEPAIAALTWRLARLHRHWGAELFSSDSAPDSGIYQWSYSSMNFAKLRVLTDGWTTNWDEDFYGEPSESEEDRPVPVIADDEVDRIRAHPMPNPNRYHYRYVAADLAWEAARHLPDNDPSLAPLYNTAGQWLASRDPMAADRFYQAMVKRCKETVMGQAADKKRWFIQDVDSLEELPGMPEGMVPPPPPPDPP